MVNTVTGTKSAAELGRTLIHEHLYVGWDGWHLDASVPTRTFDEKLQSAVERFTQLRESGIDSIVDPSPIELGRDVRLQRAVSEATGVNIVCATGLYTEANGIPPYYRLRSEDEIYEQYVAEITDGIDGTDVRAGVLKCATGNGRISDLERKCLSAAARAHVATGVPIITHTDAGSMGPEQVELFRDHGVDLKKVVIGHLDSRLDLAYLAAIMETGASIAIDRFGMPVPGDNLRMAAVVGLVKAGFGSQLFLSHDSIVGWLGKPPPLVQPQYESGALDNWNHLYIPRVILPELEKRGLTTSDIDMMLRDNVRRLFA